jgi:hypothetical protein
LTQQFREVPASIGFIARKQPSVRPQRRVSLGPCNPLRHIQLLIRCSRPCSLATADTSARTLTGGLFSPQALRRAFPLLNYRQLETFREGFVPGREQFTLEELILAALEDPVLQAGVKKAEEAAAKRAKSKAAGKGKVGSSSEQVRPREEVQTDRQSLGHNA